MISEAQMDTRSRAKDGREDPSESDEDSSSSSESTEDSSMEVPPPESIIVGKQIRQHARELLQSTTTTTSERGSVESDSNFSARVESNGNLNKQSKNYQSYHDAPPSANVASSSSSFANSAATPPWATDHENSDDYGMSVTDIATMAFSCVARCLTEGYRAASNYYGTYPQDQYPVPMTTGAQNYYQQVGSYHNEAYNHIVTTNMNNYNDAQETMFRSIPSRNGYEINDREVMDRGRIESSIDGEKSMQTPGEQSSRKEEWETVQVPSSYQGGRMGGRN